jgi:hypothetical protein
VAEAVRRRLSITVGSSARRPTLRTSPRSSGCIAALGREAWDFYRASVVLMQPAPLLAPGFPGDPGVSVCCPRRKGKVRGFSLQSLEKGIVGSATLLQCRRQNRVGPIRAGTRLHPRTLFATMPYHVCSLTHSG